MSKICEICEICGWFSPFSLPVSMARAKRIENHSGEDGILECRLMVVE